ncbi:MAG: hypothetical protein ACQEWM_12205 [Actinomycetota bacterium]
MSENRETDIGRIEADLDAAAAAVAEAEARLAAAEEARESALAAEDERRRREEDARIEALRELLPVYEERQREAFARFEATAAGRAAAPVSDCLPLWIAVVTHRTVCDNIREQVLRHDAEHAEEVYGAWEQKAGEWEQMLRGAMCVPHGGYLPGEDDDAEALKEVNALIVEESASAPRPLHRDPADRSFPGPDALGVLDPARARLEQSYNSRKYAPVSFVTAFDEAVAKRAGEDARLWIGSRVDVARSTRPSPSAGEAQRPLTRDEKVALELEKTLRRGRG